MRRVPVIYLLRGLRRGSSVLPSIVSGDSGGQPSADGLHELAASRRHSPQIALRLVVSYTTFSPLPAYYACGGTGQGRQDGTAVVFFCLTLLLPIASTFRSGASCAARTFLSPLPPTGAEAGQRQAGTLLFSMRNYYIPAEKPNLFYFFSLKLYLCATFNILHELTRSYCRRTLLPARTGI